MTKREVPAPPQSTVSWWELLSEEAGIWIQDFWLYVLSHLKTHSAGYLV